MTLKPFALLVGVATIPATGFADDALPVRAGLMLPYGVQFGGRLSASLPIGAPSPEPGWRTGWRVGPQLAVFDRPDVHTSVIVGALGGYRFESPSGCCAHSLMLGLSWLGESQITAISVDLATGEKTNTRALKHNALATLHYVFAWQFAERWGWYVDVGLGQSFLGEVADAFFFAPETGVQFTFDLGGGA